MREYDHHDPDCNVEEWAEMAMCEAERHRRFVTEEVLISSVE